MATIPFTSRLRNAWDVFRNKDPTPLNEPSVTSGVNPARQRLSYGVDRTILSSLYTRMAMDVASIDFRHVLVDAYGNYKEDVDDELNKRLNLSANIDQTSQAFKIDACLSMFDNGSVALVPVETSSNPMLTESYDILQLRAGKVIEWYPNWVRLSVYNSEKGERSEITFPKMRTAIVQNPLYSVMNERISVLQRLSRKLALLDQADERANSGKLDLLIQLPYETKSDRKKEYAEDRRKSIEDQIANSRYGVAYISGTERVIQLNRPAENNLLEQIKYQTSLLYNQLGITEQVFDGTADEQVMQNYFSHTIEPIVNEMALSMTRTFLSKTARSQGHRIMYFRNPFKLVPVSQVAEIADKLTRNEILTSNEFRSILGYRPSDDPRANELRNKNLNADNDQLQPQLPDDTEAKEVSLV